MGRRFGIQWTVHSRGDGRTRLVGSGRQNCSGGEHGGHYGDLRKKPIGMSAQLATPLGYKTLARRVSGSL